MVTKRVDTESLAERLATGLGLKTKTPGWVIEARKVIIVDPSLMVSQKATLKQGETIDPVDDVYALGSEYKLLGRK